MGGILLGLLIGLVVIIATKRIYNDTVLCTNATFISSFVGYFIAETVFYDLGYSVSGIVTLITTGLFLGIFTKSSYKEDVELSIHQFW